ncbi:MAG: VWA domain-containing protein [Deltaproteobacteria bacterium]|nr:VWA domain-containing protein [Deltaproteobacteria bacterium]
MKRILVALSLLGIVVGGAQACGDDSPEVFTSGVGTTAAAGTGGSGAGGASASTGLGGGLSVGCTPPCLTGQFCSGAVKCIPEGTCAHEDDCGDGLECDLAKATCVPGGGCGSQEVTIEPIAPNLLVVLDRSCSMKQGVGGGKSRWQVAVGALTAMMTTFNGKVRFGITLFPDKVNLDCGQDAIPFPPAPGNEAAIAALLTNSLNLNDPLYPSGPCVTNIDTGMQQAQGEPALKDPDRQSYVMLITDGAQSADCKLAGADPGTTTIIGDLLKAGVKTFVVGFGGQGIDKAAMNGFANAGGTPINNGDIDYYDSADAAALDKALADIASATLGCSFKLGKTVSSADELYVFFDNDPNGIPRDPTHMNGWDFDPATNSVTFYGKTCEDLKGGVIKDVDLVFGCNAPSPN